MIRINHANCAKSSHAVANGLPGPLHTRWSLLSLNESHRSLRWSGAAILFELEDQKLGGCGANATATPASACPSCKKGAIVAHSLASMVQ